MDLELRHLRCLVAIVDSGTFTDAALELGISQAAVSRNLMALERVLGVRLLHRTSRSITPTTAGVHALAQARQVLAAADNLVAEATTGHTRLRIGHAWSAMGRHTREFQLRWAASYPGVELQLIRTNSPTGGLAEGLCDIAVLRTSVDGRRFASAVVGRARPPRARAAPRRPPPRRPLGQAALHQARRGTAAHRPHRPAHRDHHPRPVAGRRAAALPGYPRHRRLAGDRRGRRRHRDHRRRHHGPVPARRRDLQAAARRPAHRSPGDLAPPRPPSLHARRDRPPDRPLPPPGAEARPARPKARLAPDQASRAQSTRPVSPPLTPSGHPQPSQPAAPVAPTATKSGPPIIVGRRIPYRAHFDPRSCERPRTLGAQGRFPSPRR
jgi:DNA-binding transcriptional LysR family regulator